MKPARLRDLGVFAYEETYALQKALVAERQAGAIPDTLVLVEHPHVVTLGRRRTSRDNVVRFDMPVVEVERGGDVTYHGPGQLVGYPILFLDEDERDVHVLLRNIEEGLIRAAQAFGLDAGRRDKHTGVWVGDRKLVSIGVAVRQWVSFHGFALNVSTELDRFRSINPCGFDAGVMTSMCELLGRAVSLDEVKPVVVREVGAALGRAFG